MEHPEYVFYAAIALLAVPSIALNRLAGVVVAVWAVGQLYYIETGDSMPEQLYIWTDTLGMLAAALFSRSRWDWVVTVFFWFMLLLHSIELDPKTEWWTLFALGLMQIGFVVLGNDWQRLSFLTRHRPFHRSSHSPG